MKKSNKDNEGLVVPDRCLICNNYKIICEGNLMMKGCKLITCHGFNSKKVPFKIEEKKAKKPRRSKND